MSLRPDGRRTPSRTVLRRAIQGNGVLFCPDTRGDPALARGASVRSLVPAGYMTTSIEISNDRKEILFHRAKAVGNDPDDRACRTKLVAEPVGDFEKLFTEWDRWGWHRVTFYGDLRKPVLELGDAIGWKVTEEA